jgi:hypothetical protein
MSNFEGIERRVKEECRAVGKRKAREMFMRIGRELGYNPDSTWWAPDELQAAAQPIKEFAEKRFAELEFSRVWSDAERAALDVLKKGGKA